MAISEGKQFYPKNASEIDTIIVPYYKTKAFVFMVCGISTRWKQIVGYFFTGKSINTAAFKEIVMSLIRKKW